MFSNGQISLVFAKPARFVEKVSAYLAVAAIVYLLAVVAFSVIARIVFDFSDTRINFLIPGAIEQASYALLIAVFASIPPAIKDGGLVHVDIFTKKLPVSFQNFAARLWFAVLAVVAVTLTWLFAEETQTLFLRGDTTQDLHLPMFVFYGVVTFECFALALIALDEAMSPRSQAASTV